MLKLLKNKKAQNTAEYAILIALVVGGVIAMQTYAQRTMQARLRDASVAMTDQTQSLSPVNGVVYNTAQYEPYYTDTKTDTDKTSNSTDTFAAQTRNSESKKLSGTYHDTTMYANQISNGL